MYCEIWYLTDNGIQVPQINIPFAGQDSPNYSAQLLWLLGVEGWEMVGSGAGQIPSNRDNETQEAGAGPINPGEIGHMLYFKRRLPEPSQ